MNGAEASVSEGRDSGGFAGEFLDGGRSGRRGEQVDEIFRGGLRTDGSTAE